jgi:hypothetical protein
MNYEFEVGGSLDDEDRPVRIIEGGYVCKFLYYETLHSSDPENQKIRLRFQIVEQGDSLGICLWKYYKVRKVSPPVGRGGGFAPKPLGDFYDDYCTSFGLPERLDRIPMQTKYSKYLWSCEVETVTKNFKRQKRSEHTQYSVIRSITLLRPIEPDKKSSNPSFYKPNLPKG